MEYNNPVQQYYQGIDDKAENTAPSKQLWPIYGAFTVCLQ